MFDFKGEHILTAHTVPAAIQTGQERESWDGGRVGGHKYCLGSVQ